ncbi:putative scarecrow-like protein 9 [Iris pallida]|uniref:Scarecrow-like protein 9 n=1 Tax=Iris pallida TaxID=29817 RepID=A0AAX6EAM5_IRIPA|nr:putative scarecrow-like protein 9 [Iris pallida]
MVMGTGIRDLRGGAMKGLRQSDQLFETWFREQQPFLASKTPFLDVLKGTNLDASPTLRTGTSMSTSTDVDSHEDAFSDLALTYISQMLMDEDDKVDNFHEYAALQAAEKPFYDILGQKYPPLPAQPPPDSSHASYSPDESISPSNGNSSCGPSSTSSSGGGLADGIWLNDFPERYLPSTYPTPVEFSSQSLFGSVNGGLRDVLEAKEDYLDGLSDLLRESGPAWQFRRGEEEARKFLPCEDKLVIDLEANGYWYPSKPKVESRPADVKSEKEEREYLYQSYGSRGRKNPHSDDLDLAAGRRVKQSAVSSDDGDLRSELFDDALLCKGDHFAEVIKDLRETLHILPDKSSQNGHSKGPGSGKGRGKKQPEKEVVDLRTILTQCAQMVAADDRRGAYELLKQIRQNSSDVGDGSQRLAHYFANGLEARLAGTGSEIYNSIKQSRRTATDYLKAYQLYLAVCPIKGISYFFSNQHIVDVAENATRIHVVDFGISFGFQWPSLIQRLSLRANGAPKLRITGIDFPQPGFRTRERLDETGRRLTEYAKHFNVPFEYEGISSRWEDVRIEDLAIDKDEVLVVNCLYMFRYLADETLAVDCPRDKVLNTIRRMKPDIFIHGVVNGSFSAPFFVTRFREALFFFSAIFDMLETNVPRENEQRLLSERELFGREIINIIACEGSERVERPETYRQWQVRKLRAGFVQRPLNRDMLKKAMDKVRSCYHKDFIIDQDGKWLLQGWKGRILFALSTWKPNDAS